MSEENQKTAVYRLFDKHDNLLYVGISWEPRMRCQQHAKHSEWWHLVTLREIEWFPTREEAAAAERIAIRDENPRFNRKGGDKPDSQAERRRKASVSVRAKIAGDKARDAAMRQGVPHEEATREGNRVTLEYMQNSGLDFAALRNPRHRLNSS